LAGPDLALLPGSRASFAPEWSVNGSVSYDWRVTDSLDMRATLGAQHVSDHHTGYDLDPQKLQDAYTLVNARVALSSRDDAWTLEVWAQNLTDEDYVQTSFNAPLQDGSVNGFLGAPRTIGVTLRAQY
jgi:outer membrane receptor protein involved in Fe transport